ncbi:MAG TPA: hypothetical protein VJN71_07900 [Nitrososphaerales archaeon]|nr:hypothetical protein [Nitrososphaerales archaeon]
MLKTTIDQNTLAKKSEECLNKLHFQFIHNGTPSVSEYEILKPQYFRVVIEGRSEVSVHNIILPSIDKKKGSTIDIRFDIDSDEKTIQLSKEQAKAFLKNLVQNLPDKPWKGLGFREEGKEEKKWKEWL